MQRSLALLVMMLTRPSMAIAVAHHSIAMFDNLIPTTLTGTVKSSSGRIHTGISSSQTYQERRNGKGEVENTGPEEWYVELHSTGIYVAAWTGRGTLSSRVKTST